eukprot:scaffold354243_cov19-Prasinocladus_malaysianus.AAC.1
MTACDIMGATYVGCIRFATHVASLINISNGALMHQAIMLLCAQLTAQACGAHCTGERFTIAFAASAVYDIIDIPVYSTSTLTTKIVSVTVGAVFIAMLCNVA